MLFLAEKSAKCPKWAENEPTAAALGQIIVLANGLNLAYISAFITLTYWTFHMKTSILT